MSLAQSHTRWVPVIIDNTFFTSPKQVREVDSSSDPMFPGSEGGQELVLHTLEQIPEEERSKLVFFVHLRRWNFSS